jgi:hypothetical protein
LVRSPHLLLRRGK